MTPFAGRQFLAVALLLAACGNPSTAQTPDDDVLAPNRRARLEFEAAERSFVDQLATPRLPDERRATLTIELSRTYAEHALCSAHAEAEELWRKARAATDEFADRYPRSPRLVLVQMQAALAGLAEGAQARENTAMIDDPSPWFERARVALRGAVAMLKKLDAAIADELQHRGTAARPDEKGQLSSDQLASLELHVRYQLARGMRELGRCYQPDSADRINALSQAAELLAALSQHELTADLAWPVRLDEVACLRLLGNYGAAEKKLAQADLTQASPEVAAKARAERIRLALDQNRIDKAASEAGPVGVERAAATTDAPIAQLEAYLAACQDAVQNHHDSAASKRWLQAAVDQVHAIEKACPYEASKRAYTLMFRARAGIGGSENSEVLMLFALALERAGRVDDAIAMCDKAVQLAATVGNNDHRYFVECFAGSLEYQRKNYRRALTRLRSISVEMPKNPAAANAHMYAIHSAAQLAQQQPSNLDEYEQLLREHVELWPDSPTASQAWSWLGRLEEHNGAWQEAIHAFRRVKPDQPQYAEAVAATGRCYEGALAAMRLAGNSHDLLARDAVEYLEGVIKPASRQGAMHNDATRAAVLAAARISLKEIPGGAEKAAKILRAASPAEATAPQSWKQAADALRVPVLAATGQAALAKELLKKIQFGDIAEALAMIDLLHAARDNATADGKRGLAEVELAAIDDLLAKRDALDDAAVKNLARRQADTLVEVGRRGEAVAALEALCKKYPRDGQAQEDLAALLSAGRDRESLQAALVQWNEVAAHSRPGSPRWFRAHLAIARAQLDLDQPAEARATVKRVEASHPDFGGAPLKVQFLQLLAECNAQPAQKK